MEIYVKNDVPEPVEYNTPDGSVSAKEIRRRQSDGQNNEGRLRDQEHN